MEKEKNEYGVDEKRGSFFKRDGVTDNKSMLADGRSDAPLLVLSDVSKSYGGTNALNGVSFTAREGRVIGLLGPRGSGKSTVIKLIAGLLAADNGEILFMGEELGCASRRAVSYLPEKNPLPLYFTVAEAVSFFEDFFEDFDRERAEEIIGDFSIARHKKIKTLSFPEREKLILALVMSRRAHLYLLDEPISGVEPAARAYIIDTVLRNVPENSTIIISTHMISDVEKIMDEFIFIKYGEVYASDTVQHMSETYGKTVDEYFKEVFRC